MFISCVTSQWFGITSWVCGLRGLTFNFNRDRLLSKGHLRAETGVLLLKAHLELFSQQFYATALQPMHPCHLIVTSPVPSAHRPGLTPVSWGASEQKETTPTPLLPSLVACWWRVPSQAGLGGENLLEVFSHPIVGETENIFSNDNASSSSLRDFIVLVFDIEVFQIKFS